MRPAAACFIHFFIPSRHIILRQAVCLFVKIPKNYASYPLRCVHNRILCSQHSEPKSELWRVVGVINLWPQLRHSHPTRAPLSDSKPPQWFKSTVTEWLCYCPEFWYIILIRLIWNNEIYTSERLRQKSPRYYQIKNDISKMEKILDSTYPSL